MNELNENEIWWGFIYCSLFVLKIGIVAIPLIPICAYLWAISGAGASKLYRRLGVPVITSGLSAIVLQSVQPLYSIPLAFAVLSLGYGIPDETDDGSFLGGLGWNISHVNAELITRSIIIALLTIANIPTLLTR